MGCSGGSRTWSKSSRENYRGPVHQWRVHMGSSTGNTITRQQEQESHKPQVRNEIKEHILIQIREDCNFFKVIKDKYRDDIDIAKEAVCIDGLLLEYVSDRLRATDIVVRLAIKENPLALEFVCSELRDDEEIVLDAVQGNGLALEFASSRIKLCSTKIILTAVKQNGLAVRFAKSINKEIALEAVKQNGLALIYLGQLRADRDVVIEAVKENGRAIQYANKIFWADAEIMALVASKKESALYLALLDNSLRSNKEFIKKIYRYNYEYLKYAHPDTADEIRFEFLRRFSKIRLLNSFNMLQIISVKLSKVIHLKKHHQLNK